MMDWSAISNMIIKAADNMNRGVENAGKAGDGTNGVDYSNVDTGAEGAGSTGGGVGGYQKPEEQDTGGVESTTSAVKGMANMAKDAITNIGSKGGDTGGEEGQQDESQKDNEGGNTKGIGSNLNIGGMKMPKDSDERLKNIFGEDEDAIKCFAKINAIKFTYNDKAKEVHPGKENGVDDDVHYGVKAQDLLKNPLTESAVSKDASGYLQVDPSELTMANSAVISELCKRIEILEKILGVKVV